MKLTVRFSDYESKAVEFTHTQHMPPVNYRTATIELTPEQTLALSPRVLGTYNQKPYYETIEVVALEDS